MSGFQLPQMDFGPGAPVNPAYNFTTNPAGLGGTTAPGVGGITPDAWTAALAKFGFGGTNNSGNTPLSWNLGTGQLAVSGLGTLGNLYGAWQANQMANKQFSMARDVANANITNQIQSYNTRLEDRARARAVTEGRDESYVSNYLDKNKLADRRIG